MKTTLLAGLLATAAIPAAAQTATTMNVTQVFGTVDPAKITDYTEYMAAVNLYDGLTTVAGDGSIVPQLASDWTVSEDSLTYTFTLKEGATFTDGSPVEAKDVVWSLQRLIALNEGPSYLFAGLIDPEAVVATDDRTVEITLNRVFAPFLAATPLILIVNSDVAMEEGSGDWAEDLLGETPEGAGPYTIASWNRGSEMVIERFEDYHGGFTGTPLDRIRFVVTNDEATVKALATSGELGISSPNQATETYDSIGAMEGYEIETTPTATGFYIKMNTQAAPTDDIHLRRAIQYATDYQTIREVIYPGFEMAGPLSPSFEDAYLDTLEAPVYDLDKAAEELAQSAYAGEDLTIPLAYVAGLSFEEDIALLMQANLEAIGITVELQPEPWNRITELASDPSTTPALTQVFNGPSYPSPDSVFFVQYHSDSAGTWASMEWLEDPEIDALIDASRAETDTGARNEIYKELQQKLVDGASDVYLTFEEERQAMSTCLQGYTYVPMMSWQYDFSRMSWDCSAG
ncbi:ABC transporter substrate-binding protein [Pseudoroseicyclus aestuarii]|uniref:Peptide/nickel transport system substrate-binding protein n=1 Tax=Pseudoroseicyclus aestuarii TaxID=1795041 RepID=A0A318STE3_9RHOB|nr:ABC transporter substrate-binding protein [Pseudoroseicyclus aestuarii]PYE82572.1 peptide/nickel transport system substrate-binding protein [Pseudoroseicyclus aestuarii]